MHELVTKLCIHVVLSYVKSISKLRLVWFEDQTDKQRLRIFMSLSPVWCP